MKFSEIHKLEHLIRLRPLAVEMLERAVGPKCWEHLDEPLPAFCDHFGLLSETLLDHVAALPVVPAKADWGTHPLYYLIDFLSADHSDFRDRLLPDLRSFLDIHGIPTFPDRYVAELILQDFQAFGREFVCHMAEEEDVIFPAILRSEALSRHPHLTLKPQSGSRLKKRLASPSLPEEAFSRMLVDITEKVRNQQVSPSFAGRYAAILQTLAAFQCRLLQHANLESETLFPRAGLIDGELTGRDARS